jgi:hypothetical protein
MTALRSHSKDGKLLYGLCVRGSSCDVRFCVAIMVGWLERGLLVRIGLRVGGEVNRRGSIASMTRSARIGEGGRINFHFHTSRWVVGGDTGMGERIQEGIEWWAGISDSWTVRFGWDEALTGGGEGQKERKEEKSGI